MEYQFIPSCEIFDFATIPLSSNCQISIEDLEKYFTYFDSAKCTITVNDWKSFANKHFFMDESLSELIYHLYCFSFLDLPTIIDEVEFVSFGIYLFCYCFQNTLKSSPRMLEAISPKETSGSLTYSQLFSRGTLLKKRVNFIQTNLFKLFSFFDQETHHLLFDELSSIIINPDSKIKVIDAMRTLNYNSTIDEKIGFLESLIVPHISHYLCVHRANIVKKCLHFNDCMSDTFIELYDCQHSQFYFTSSAKGLVLSQLDHCTVYIGAAKWILVAHCTNLRLVGTCRSLRIHSSNDCDIMVHTSILSPILTGRTHNITFEPFNSSHSSIEADMLSSHVSPITGNGTDKEKTDCLWKTPLIISHSYSPRRSNLKKQPIYKIKDPSNHTPFIVPFRENSNVPLCPIVLPLEYQKAIENKLLLLDNFKNEKGQLFESITSKVVDEMDKTCIKDEIAKNDISHFISSCFIEYLIQNDKIKEISNILNWEE
eukprot:TRINITY_DN2663_c0_g1_i3.p1 TRINITY_DN2663_c0_g1~~TRINITY_DN2663_c0_g1_i3.p1  ORF type:complete len:494 (-),score=98.27 TRINITY_DN2663_c0_g1_i3:9-1460(-)